MNGIQSHTRVDRRTFVAGAATSAAGLATAPGSAPVRAADRTAGEECMTIVYENGEGVHFDFDYYNDTHMPLIMDRYGASISRFELRRGQPAADGMPPPYIATVTIWIADGEAFDAAATRHQAALQADVPRFTNARLIAQRDRIVGVATG